MNEQYTSPDLTLISVNNLVVTGASGGDVPPLGENESEIIK